MGAAVWPRKCVGGGGAPPPRSLALFIVVVPQCLALPPLANQGGEVDEWQAGLPIVSCGGWGGRPRSVRHVRIVGPPDRASLASSRARHGAAGEPSCHLPWGDPKFPRVRLGAHDVGGCGGHGERCLSRPSSLREAERRARCGAALP